MGTKVDLDRATARAWRMYERDLAWRIAELEWEDRLLLEVEGVEPAEGCLPYAQVFCEDDRVVAEVSSNRFLAQSCRLGKEARRELRSLGWDKPDEQHDNYWCPADHGCEVDAATVAEMIVNALRDVFGVRHPAFLVDAEDVVATEDPAYDAPPTRPGPNDDVLRSEVEAALEADLGAAPKQDGDGDYPFACGDHSVVFVRPVGGARPVVEIFCTLVLDATDRERAAYEAAVLNRDFRWAKIALIGDTIMLRADVLAGPLAPDHLRFVLDEVCEFVHRVGRDTAFRAGGRCFLDAPPTGA